MGTEKGVKLDEGKNRLGLVFCGFAPALWEGGRVGTFGANKYTENGWQSVPKGEGRYMDALLRHTFKFFMNEETDQESGLHHLAHVAWNALAILTLLLKGKKFQTNQEKLQKIFKSYEEDQ